MFHQQRRQSEYLAQRKNFFFPKISSPSDDQAIQVSLFIVETRAWLINKTVGNVTGPSPQKALLPSSSSWTLRSCVPTQTTPPLKCWALVFNKSFHLPEPWTRGFFRLWPETNQKRYSHFHSQIDGSFPRPKYFSTQSPSLSSKFNKHFTYVRLAQ